MPRWLAFEVLASTDMLVTLQAIQIEAARTLLCIDPRHPVTCDMTQWRNVRILGSYDNRWSQAWPGHRDDQKSL